MNAVLGQTLRRDEDQSSPMRQFIQDGEVEEEVTESDHLDELAECDAQNRRRVPGRHPPWPWPGSAGSLPVTA